MKAYELIWAHRYEEAIADLRRELESNPENIAAVEGMAKALRAKGEYPEALCFFERLAIHSKMDRVANLLAPGSAAWQIDIATLHWLLEERSEAMRLMHGLAAGILDGSIKYADAAGGMSQGLLLYYMAVTENVAREVSFALDYVNNRVKHALSHVWPCPIARYHLGEITFQTVMEAVNRQPNLAGSPNPANLELGRRRRLTLALFHDGVRSRAQDDDEHFLVRMRECYGLENPLIEQEWYLARYEVQKVDKPTRAK